MHIYDYLIIGAGPAGIQLGYYFEQENHDYVILEGSDVPGAFFQEFPRHRKLISINKVYTGYDDPEINLRWDWNSLLSDDYNISLKDYTQEYLPNAEHFVTYLSDFVKKFDLNIRYGVKVMRVNKDDTFHITDQNGNTYAAKQLIVATGAFKPYVPPIPGIDLAEVYTDVSVDPEDFINQRVLIIGKGNSGFETADNLISTAALIHIASPQSIKMAWQSHFVGHLRAVNNNILDTYQLKSQNAILDATIEEIRCHENQFVVSFSYAHAHGEREDLVYDRVIVCTGFRFDNSIFDESCCPNLVIKDRFPDQTSSWESANVKDLYFAGALMQMRDYKQCTGAFIHGFRYNVRALYHILNRKYHSQEWPQTSVACNAITITNAVIERVNKTSALWQLFGFLGDLIIIPKHGQYACHYEEMPVDYIHASDFGKHAHYYVITLEYGANHDKHDPFSAIRIERHDVESASESNFLHPVIRRYNGSELIAEHHIIEDLEAEWLETEHIEPLRAFFEEQLQDSSTAHQKLIYV